MEKKKNIVPNSSLKFVGFLGTKKGEIPKGWSLKQIMNNKK